mgnify:CR=1 FL=1
MPVDGEQGYFDGIVKTNSISGDALRYFSESFGERFWRGLKAAVDGQIKKYIFLPSNRIEWIMVGKKRDYLIISEFYCSCEDFYINVVLRRSVKYCYHILAKKLAEALKSFEEIKVEDTKYERFMCEWRKIEDG